MIHICIEKVAIIIKNIGERKMGAYGYYHSVTVNDGQDKMLFLPVKHMATWEQKGITVGDTIIIDKITDKLNGREYTLTTFEHDKPSS